MNFSSSVCNLCGRGEQHLYRCARCRRAVYCSKEHQREHWKVHRVLCVADNKTEEGKVNFVALGQSTIKDQVKLFPDVALLNNGKDPTQLLLCDLQSQGDILAACSISTASDATSRSSPTSGLCQSDGDSVSKNRNTSDTQENPDGVVEDLLVDSKSTPLKSSHNKNFEETVVEMGSVTLTSECSLKPETRWQSSLENISTKQTTIPPFLHQSFNRDISSKEQLQRSSMEWMTQICQYVVRDLEKYGICVVDNFMGKERAESIHRSVSSLYRSGIFVEGETVSPSLETTKNVRSDKIAWVDGTEKNCVDIAYFISTVDTIIMNSIRMKGNGQLGQRTIGGRTKAMIACYPGSGSHYVKHVDNPNRDGRCITATYYVNKDWDAQTVGGLLRIFPQGWANQVVDIEPILDRMVFFWSDRRNPHEVQPSFRTRYAVTVWYFDAKEREEARIRYSRECAMKKTLKPKE